MRRTRVGTDSVAPVSASALDPESAQVAATPLCEFVAMETERLLLPGGYGSLAADLPSDAGSAARRRTRKVGAAFDTRFAASRFGGVVRHGCQRAGHGERNDRHSTEHRTDSPRGLQPLHAHGDAHHLPGRCPNPVQPKCAEHSHSRNDPGGYTRSQAWPPGRCAFPLLGFDLAALLGPRPALSFSFRGRTAAGIEPRLMNRRNLAWPACPAARVMVL